VRLGVLALANDTIIVTIEGIEASNGEIVKYCWPNKPDYGTGVNYVKGLRRPPSADSSAWKLVKGVIETGSFDVFLERYRSDGSHGPINFELTRPRAIDTLAIARNKTDTTFTWHQDNSDAGRSADDRIYIGRETLEVTVATGNLHTTTVQRGAGDSPAQEHSVGSPVYATPPVLTGRTVSVYRVAQTGASAGAETLILRGQIDSEASASISEVRITCTEHFGERLLNRQPERIMVTRTQVNEAVRRGGDWIPRIASGAPGSNVSPAFNTGGTYIWIPDLSIVVATAYNESVTDTWGAGERLVVWPRYVASAEWPGQSVLGYQVALSDKDAPFPIFKRDSTFSDNPVDIALNIMTSIDGTNYDSANSRPNWDLGTTLYPNLSLAIDQSLIDWQAFEDARAELNSVRADRFWLGGPQTHKFTELMFELLWPWGYAVGTRRDGKWTIVRFSDVYPADTTVVIDQSDILEPAQIGAAAIGRQVDTLDLLVEPGPDRSTVDRVEVPEVTQRQLYPPGAGENLVVNAVPSAWQYFAEGGHLRALLAERTVRVAEKIQTLTMRINSAHLDAVHLGTLVTVRDIAIVDPEDGNNLTWVSTPLGGIILSVTGVNYDPGEAEIEVALTDSLANYAHFSPAAVVSSWASGTKTITCSTGVFHADEPAQFAAQDVVILVDKNLAARSDTGGTHPTRVGSISSPDIVLDTDSSWSDGDFENAAGTKLTPVAGDIVIFSLYDEVQPSQQGVFAWAADDGPLSGNLEHLGAADDDPNRYGS
jgi:hypothetical protein